MLTIDQWREQGECLDYRSHQVFYRAGGCADAPVLLLIHGFPTCSWDWHKVWDALAPHFHLVALDLIGFGFSDKPRHHDYSIRDQAQLCLALLDHLNLDRVHLFAHDYGDTVAQELMALAGEGGFPHIESVVLLNGGLFPETHHALLVQKLLMSPVGFLVSKLFSFRKFKRNMDAICAVNIDAGELETYWHLMNHNNGLAVIPKLIRYMQERRDNRERWVGALQQAGYPVGLINGIDDPISGGHMVERYRQIVSEDDIVELAGVGHYPQVEAPGAVLEVAFAFWQGHHLLPS